MPSSIKQNYEQVGFSGSEGTMMTGQCRQVIGDAVATRALTAKESGALCLFDRAAGVVYTLPPLSATAIGMFFEFQTTVTVTSNAAKVITSAATEFITGVVSLAIVGAATTLAAAGNGTTHIAISSNGTTTGGVIGDRYRLTAVSSTLWAVDGVISGSGALATPLSTT